MNTRKYLLVLTSCLWLGLTSIAQAKPIDPKVIHLLNRLSLGIRPGEIDRVQKLGIDRYIQQQLNPNTIAEPPILSERLAKLDTIALMPVELFQRYNPNRQVDSQNPLIATKRVQQ